MLEIASRLEESLAAGKEGDAGYLGRRLVAMAQHNMIEEERDVFPLVIASELFQGAAQLAVGDGPDAGLGAEGAGVGAGPELEVRPALLPGVRYGANFRVVLGQVHDQLGDSGLELAENCR